MALQRNGKSKLEKLVMSSNKLTSLGAFIVSNALKEGGGRSLHSLRYLDLSWNKLGGDGGRNLALALEAREKAAGRFSLFVRQCSLDTTVQAALREAVAKSASDVEVVGEWS